MRSAGWTRRDFDRLLERHAGRVRLVAVTGGSNVTGTCRDIHRLAAKAHAAGARILVDCASWRRTGRSGCAGSTIPGHLDYVALSAHKLYAPFGTGALDRSARHLRARASRSIAAAGRSSSCRSTAWTWAAAPERDEAGTPERGGRGGAGSGDPGAEGHGHGRDRRHEAELTGTRCAHGRGSKDCGSMATPIRGGRRGAPRGDRLQPRASSRTPWSRLCSRPSSASGCATAASARTRYLIRLLGLSDADVFRGCAAAWRPAIAGRFRGWCG